MNSNISSNISQSVIPNTLNFVYEGLRSKLDLKENYVSQVNYKTHFVCITRYKVVHFHLRQITPENINISELVMNKLY